MKIGMTLPSMVPDTEYSRDTTLDWCRLIDQGPFESISVGERTTYPNQEITVLLSAAAALTERVKLYSTIFIVPTHATAVLAKQAATIDVLSNGRLTVGIGSGGREHDYIAAEKPFNNRFSRMEQQVHELKSLWAGQPPFTDADRVGPAPVQAGGPPLFAGVGGPKSLARAAQWADGLFGQNVGDGNYANFSHYVDNAHSLWKEAGRKTKPYITTSFWYALGPNAKTQLEHYAKSYMDILGQGAVDYILSQQSIDSEAALIDALDTFQSAGCDEVILVPTSAETAELDRTMAALAKR